MVRLVFIFFILIICFNGFGQVNYESKAITLLNKKLYKQAEEVYREAVHYNPNDHYLRVKLGDVLWWQGKYKEAQHEFLQVIGKDSTYTLAYRRSGLAYFREGKYKKSIRRYERGLEFTCRSEDNLVAIYHGLGDAYANLLETDGLDSIEIDRMLFCFEKSLELRPTLKEFDYMRTFILKIRAHRPKKQLARWMFKN